MSKQFYFKEFSFAQVRNLTHRQDPSGATIPDQSGLWSHGNEGVLRILQSFSITGTLASDCLMSYPGHSW